MAAVMMLLVVAQRGPDRLSGIRGRVEPVHQSLESISAAYQALQGPIAVIHTVGRRELANVPCPRGRTFVSSGVHTSHHGAANRLDYELLCLLQFGLLIAWSTRAKAFG